MSINVALKTSVGEIHLTLDSVKAPKSTQNFINYAEKGHYNGTVFHRVIDGFMIQGGGMDASLNSKATEAPIGNEANNGLKNNVGTIAMARTSDPHSATSQFFINVADNGFLDHTAETPEGWGYAVFGQVTAGLDVVQKIAKVETARKGHHSDVPVTPIVIETVTVSKDEQPAAAE